jgi:hypothetical protein
LRVALASWIHSDRPEILEMAAQMFVAFSGPKSEPLGVEDVKAIMTVLTPTLRKRTNGSGK